MISDLLLDALFALIGAVVSLFPVFTVPTGLGFTLLAAANIVFPIDVLLYWIGITLAFGVVAMAYWGIMVIVNLVRGSGA